MATDIYPGSLGHQRITGAAGGVSLSTTPAFVALHQGTKYVDLIPRNFSTAVLARYIECPYLTILLTHDALATKAQDVSRVAQDGSTNTNVIMNNMPTLANGGALWIGASTRFRGVDVNVNAVNTTSSSDLTVHYPNNALTLTDISATDNTNSTESLDQDGTVVWTIPALNGWYAATLKEIAAANGIAISATTPEADVKMFWTRWTWDAVVDALTSLYHMLAINESTAYTEVPESLGTGFRVNQGKGDVGISGFEILTNAGTGNMIVSCATLDGRFTEGVVE
mgnify:CR=1 FL=1|jgi:hypothetical protein